MTNITKETITTSSDTDNSTASQPIARETDSYQMAGYLVYLIFGALNALLVFRFVLKLLGANPTSGFVDFVYGLSGIFVAPFAGIFSTSTAQGAETTSVFEPATLVAFFVYALIAWGIVALIRTLSVKQQD